ncbi:amidohydrolase 2 [Gluconacetobacter sacchari DSM 12717]|uniref:Amidohydrolase family protein n=2 Tax=Gluconacetobacter sacchari TaxID=92759 RepID=A0A7W4IFF8_9PROT|nr:amidohydrolase family protein [Gluconacetobacter sacchari]MBB2161762.1 amidohydrolase family protein [Gluconacetobacter sacchari]GBQ20053.1 amidohydrolase 2 [Gluconacetobacter sacchari DSM 12717]
MIIDAYNNIWTAQQKSDYLTSETYSVEMMLRDMDDAGVDMAVGCSLGQMIDNDYTALVGWTYSDRIIPFGQVNARAADAADQVRRDHDRHGFRGLKLHPVLHGYHVVDHGLLDPIFDACAERGIMVLFNALDDAFIHPLGIEEIAKHYPSVPTIIAHMGTVWNVNEAILVAKRTPNIYLETSSTQLIEVRMAYRDVGPEKIIMGTDWPGSDFDLERRKIAKAVPNPAHRAMIEGENLQRLLGLA